MPSGPLDAKQPRFIAPLAKRTTPYDCISGKDHDGVVGIRNEVGRPIAAQTEP